jgi:hypothetical protein
MSMGMIYELLKMPKTERKKFLDDVKRQETAEKMKIQGKNALQNKAEK